jgi:hypothetical protein
LQLAVDIERATHRDLGNYNWRAVAGRLRQHCSRLCVIRAAAALPTAIRRE